MVRGVVRVGEAVAVVVVAVIAVDDQQALPVVGDVILEQVSANET